MEKLKDFFNNIFGGSSTPAQAKYSGETNIVNQFLTEIINKNEQNFNTYNANYNSTMTGDKNINVMNSKGTTIKASTSSDSIVLSAFTSTLSDMINDAMTVSNDSKVNLDVLAALTNSLKNSKALSDAKGEVNITEINNMTTTSQDIQSIINTANYCSTQKCTNEVMLGGLNINVLNSANTWIELEDNISSSITSNTESIAELAKDANVLSEKDVESIVEKTLSADQEVEDTGIIENAGNAASDVIEKTGDAAKKVETGFMEGLMVPIIVGVVVVIVIFFIFVFILIFALKRR